MFESFCTYTVFALFFPPGIARVNVSGSSLNALFKLLCPDTGPSPSSLVIILKVSFPSLPLSTNGLIPKGLFPHRGLLFSFDNCSVSVSDKKVPKIVSPFGLIISSLGGGSVIIPQLVLLVPLGGGIKRSKMHVPPDCGTNDNPNKSGFTG